MKWTLRCLGLIDLLAFVAVFMPHSWMAGAYSFAGLGTFPTAPIVGYLARSASAVYGLHGVLVLYMSCDVNRYWPLIRFFASAAVLHGMVMLSIDIREKMPLWWTAIEGPCFAATGLIVLLAQALARTRPTSP